MFLFLRPVAGVVVARRQNRQIGEGNHTLAQDRAAGGPYETALGQAVQGFLGEVVEVLVRVKPRESRPQLARGGLVPGSDSTAAFPGLLRREAIRRIPGDAKGAAVVEEIVFVISRIQVWRKVPRTQPTTPVQVLRFPVVRLEHAPGWAATVLDTRPSRLGNVNKLHAPRIPD